VFCRQRKDSRLPRGGEQVSVVAASEHPFGSALAPLAQAAGPLYLSQGSEALRQLYGQVLAWPPPLPGASMQLPLAAAGLVVAAVVPAFAALPPPQPEVGAAAQVGHGAFGAAVFRARAGALAASQAFPTALCAIRAGSLVRLCLFPPCTRLGTQAGPALRTIPR
jgi:hypothetical protein